MEDCPIDQTPGSPRPVSLRAAIIGLFLSAVVSLWGQYAADHLGYNYMTYGQLPTCFLLPFLLFVLGPNIALGSVAPRRALTRSELLVIFSMGLIGSMVPDWAMTRYLIAIITAPYYFASPENQWADKFFSALPDWLVLRDERGAARTFFEGLAAGQSIPWSTWVVPLFWWLSFFAALLFVGACLVVILRKQWVEHEKLRFPLGQVALHVVGVEDEAAHSAWPAFFRTRMFQAGLGIALFVMLWNCIAYWDVLPRIPIAYSDGFDLTLGRAFPPIPIRPDLYALCFSFFVNVEILFSVWFFILLVSIIEAGILNRIGVFAPSSTFVKGGLPSIQSIGGMIVFVLWGLWMARPHLREVLRKAVGRPTALSDEDELFSYRTAVIGLVIGLLYVVGWLHSAGFSLPVLALFLFCLFVFYLAMVRMMAEAGLVTLDLPINANQFTVGMVGSVHLSRPDLTALGLANAFARNWRTFTMVGLSHVAWLRDRVWPGRRHLFGWLCLAFGTSALSSILYVIYAGYTTGANNLRSGPGGLGVGFYSMIIQWVDNATQVSRLEILFLISGMILNILLTAGRYLFYWWPLHPIGFVALTSDSVLRVVFPIFQAWLIQTLLLRFGGVRLYRKTQPLFLGLLVGYVLGVGVSYVVDSVWFPGTPHATEAF